MRTWLLHIGEELPVDGQTRLFRYGYLANALQDAGHEVLRWAPTFRHSTKTQRFSTDVRVPITERYAVQLVYAPGYQRNASFARLRTYRILERRFRAMAVHEAPPDVIVAAIPSLEWAQAAIDFGRARGIPVVIDVRDLWPDVYLNSLPARARGLGRFLLAPYRRVASRVCRQATALTAVSQSYLNWALGHAGRPQRELDRVVPLGYERIEISTNEHDKHIARLQAQGIDPSLPTCLFAGILERSSDVETVVRAARRLEQRGAEVQFILCGDGSKAAALRRQAAGLRNVHFLGWVDGAMLQSAAAISSIGLCAYASDALQSLPNKPFEYMASRLAIVSSLSGELANLLEKSGSGVTYTAGDDEGMANAIARLVGQPERLAAMRSNGYTTWSQSFRSCEIYCDFAARLASLTSLTRAAA